MKLFLRFALATAIIAFSASSGLAVGRMLSVGDHVPVFSYHQLNGRILRNVELRGHPYVLWLVASWCSSCQAGSAVVGEHIDMLKKHGVRVVELRLSKDLGAAGLGLQTFQRAVGPKAFSSNWYWGEASQAQTLALDPRGYADLYYLVDRRGTIVAIDGNPSASWDTIQKFSESVHERE